MSIDEIAKELGIPRELVADTASSAELRKLASS
jgi:uncharacterized membrane protein